MIDCQDYQFYKTLLESTRAIPWKIDWRTKEFSYIELHKLKAFWDGIKIVGKLHRTG